MSSNESGIKVTIIGSGTCVPSLKRSSCAVLAEVGKAKLLFDSGPGTMRRLLEADTTIFDISHIFYSHFHPDHTAEFVPFLFSTKYPNDQQREDPLSVTAGRGLLDFYSRLKAVYGQWIELASGLFRIVELDNTAPDTRRYDDFTVESMPVEHNEESIAFRIDVSDGASVVYSGDTGYSDNLVTLASNADILICESAFPDDLKVSGHLTTSLAGEIAALANVREGYML